MKGLATIVVCTLVLPACDDPPCPFGAAQRIHLGGLHMAPGTYHHHDFTAPELDRLAIDLASAEIPGQTARVDGWVTRGDCAELFDRPYPRPDGSLPAARCQMLVGPVRAGEVSGRVEVSPGSYRAFFYARADNQTPAEYDADVVIWGQSCRIGPTF